MFFGEQPEQAEKRRQMLEILGSVAPDDRHTVRIVAQGLKTDEFTYHGVFFEWVRPFGRLKARQIWALAKPDPDALVDLFEMRNEAANRQARFTPRTAAELEAMPPQQFRIKGVLPAEGIAAVYGASGSAKSFLCTAAAAAIAEGQRFFGYPTRQAFVLYVALEGEGGYRGRVRAWQRHHGRPMPDGLRFLLDPFRLTEPQDVADLAAICPPGVVVIIDTLNRAAPGADENSSRDMGAMIEGAKTLQRLTAGLVILVAHTGKNSEKGLRGHSSLFAALDAAILVERAGDARTWRIEKAKDGEDGATHGFRLEGVVIGQDDFGEEITSAVVISDHNATNSDKPLTGNRRLALQTFHEAANSHGTIAEDGSFAGVPIAAWREAFYRASPAENDDAKRKAFNRARNDLIEIGALTVENDVYRRSGANSNIENALIATTLKAGRDMSGTLA
jgi:hypothetical protein